MTGAPVETATPGVKRAFVLHLLAEGFRCPDAAWEKRFRALTRDAAREGLAVTVLPTEELRVDHFRLFGSAPACPLELTLHLAENPFEQARMMAHMAGFYRAFGLEAESGERPDHLPLALAFLSFLTLKEINAVAKNLTEGREVTAKAVADFTREFLTPGVAAFTSKLATLTSNPFYRSLAELLRREVFAIQPPVVEPASCWEPRTDDADEGEMTCGVLKQPLH